MLIGADIFALLLTEELKPIDADLMAIHTKLGWAVIDRLRRSIDSQRDSIISTDYTYLLMQVKKHMQPVYF